MIIDEEIMANPVSEWPKVDVLLAFYSEGFDLDKVIEYSNLVKPLNINDLEKQKILLNRELTYSYLEKHKIPVISYIKKKINDSSIEDEDYLVIGEKRLQRPFIEKPIDAESHDIYI